jgi:hypothetical protein
MDLDFGMLVVAITVVSVLVFRGDGDIIGLASASRTLTILATFRF